jgi:3-deoxy-D-manno-octulosonate 8-phosphate phosphatase (KDO 8-P phosphatase)
MNLSKSLLARIARIRMFVFDVDGVLTDGGIYLGDAGEMKRFDVRDGMGISLARRAGLHVVFLTARKSEAVRRRAEELKVEEVHQGVRDKLESLKQIALKLNISPDEVLYMGDDINDLPVLRHVGFAAAPADAARDVQEYTHHVTLARAGFGAAREVIEIVLRNQGKWDALLAEYLETPDAIRQ